MGHDIQVRGCSLAPFLLPSTCRYFLTWTSTGNFLVISWKVCAARMGFGEGGLTLRSLWGVTADRGLPHRVRVGFLIVTADAKDQCWWKKINGMARPRPNLEALSRRVMIYHARVSQLRLEIGLDLLTSRGVSVSCCVMLGTLQSHNRQIEILTITHTNLIIHQASTSSTPRVLSSPSQQQNSGNSPSSPCPVPP